MLMHGHHSIRAFHFELWEGQSVSEVFVGVQGAGPLAGVVRGQCPLTYENFVFGGHKICNFIAFHYPFSSKIA